jgi:hypothetical protein
MRCDVMAAGDVPVGQQPPPMWVDFSRCASFLPDGDALGHVLEPSAWQNNWRTKRDRSCEIGGGGLVVVDDGS